jgi:tRNA threonylcarbamoyl adenosine modification protein (Sua5/YciO/YrdC/YwlC family)
MKLLTSPLTWLVAAHPPPGYLLPYLALMAMFLSIHPDNPQPRLIRQVADTLMKGGVIVYPTDTLYALGCSMHSRSGLQRIARIKQTDPQKALLSFVCHSLKDLSRYARQVDTPVFRLLKQYLPGPYTFVLPASREVPKMMQSKKSTIGLRVPDHPIALAIAEQLEHPVLSASLPFNEPEDVSDIDLIRENFENLVDLIVDGGRGGIEPSTVVDLTADEPVLLRQGKGAWE